jgi:signal transduction histidine kinase
VRLKVLVPVLCVCAALACLWPGDAWASAQAKRVLILFETESNLPVAIIIGTVLREVLRTDLASGPVDYEEFLDLDRFPGPEHKKRMAAFLREKYAGTPIDVVIAGGNRALDFMLENRADLFKGASLTFVAVGAGFAAQRHLPSDVVGITMRTYLAPTIELALRLQPNAHQLVVVTGASDFDRDWEATARQQLSPYENRLNPAYLSGLPLEELLHRLSQLPRDAIVLYLTILKDGAGRQFHPRDVAKLISEASSAPVYGVYDSYLENGILGGHIDAYEAMGRAAGRLALRMLAGEHPTTADLGAADTSADYVNWRQLQRWGIDESRLPPDAIVRFKEPSLWATYRWQIIAVFGLIVILFSLVVALLIQARRRQRAEGELATQRAELAHLSRVATLGELSGALAHELSQPLTSILSNAQAAQQLLREERADLPEIRSIMADIVAEDLRAGEVIRNLRSLFKNGEPRRETLDLSAEIAEVQKMLHSEVITRNVKVVTELSSGLARVKGDRVQLQQVFLNLFLNACDAVKHNKPGDRLLRISARANENGAVQVCYADNGVGIDSEMMDKIFQPFVTSKREGLGLGLAVCRTIIQAHGGRLWATNNARRGASFWIALPKAL